MTFISISKDNGIAIVTLNRSKVNALNEPFIEQLNSTFINLENDKTVEAVIITGQGKFFSFGFDIPELLGYSKESFTRYLIKFTNLYTSMFLFPKPLVAALNGHTIAGGCMLSLACDFRIIVSEKAKISLNEISFGALVFAGSIELLKYCVNQRNAESILFSGKMYSANEAIKLGLVDQISSYEKLMDDSIKIAREFANKDKTAFRGLKSLLRKPVAEEMKKKEMDSIRKFVDVWYSKETRKSLKKIKIYS
ncbi:MAG: enoyl-CoA hydratase/isomerase family protein [Candidatus Aminicenantes bacterium]|nr:enoyl-CoA hydratase/isomerase family protein [Candidatus Aminicenantes bacterium]